jgi:YhgE/Pip-like protein
MRRSPVFSAPSVWVLPAIVVALLIFVVTLVYFGSVVDPVGHMRGMPVAIVDQDAGATLRSEHVDFGRAIANALTASSAINGRLSLHERSLRGAESKMDVGKTYTAVVIPPGFTRSLLALAGVPLPLGRSRAKPTVELLTNPRAGSLGVGLTTGVLQPALAVVSHRLGQELARDAGGPQTAATSAFLADPLTVETVQYRPLQSHTALGLSAFYISLLTIFCGFLGAVVLNMSVDAELGYAATEIGPVWRQRQPVAIRRRETLLGKWAMAIPLSFVMTGLMLAAATGILGMDTPHFWLLWLLTWFAATVVALGTLVFFAALGTLGQILALLVFIYLSLASSGGTVPLQALSGFFRFLANFEPLRQVLGGVKAILYFNARGDAGLTRAFVATAAGLVLWVIVGLAVTTWYDRKKLYRMPPELLEYIDNAVRDYHTHRNPVADGEPERA